jgi:hypothetical protein
MRSTPLARVCLTLALAVGLGATPALAQKKNGGNDHRRPGVERPELRHRDGRQVPPGWCQGRGNPHNTRENCGRQERRDVRYDRRDDRRYERRDDRRDDRYGRGVIVRNRSFTMEHQSFHRALDDKYRRLAARRPYDRQYQQRLRIQKQEEHDRWHRRMGIDHNGRRW